MTFLVGLDVVLEALKLYRQRKRFKADELMHFARICRVGNASLPGGDAVTDPSLQNIAASVHQRLLKQVKLL